MLAGVGVTWYTWLEQGRPINASTQVLDAVARTLMLDQPEREHLYRLADVPEAVAAAEEAATVAQVAPELQRILDGLASLPASIMNERFDLLAWNAAYAALFPGVVRQPTASATRCGCPYHAPCCNRSEPRRAARHAVAAPRYLRPRRRQAAWTKFVRAQAASPEFGKLWAQHEVASPTTYLKIFKHPAHDRLVMTTTSLAILAAPGTRMVVYTPADDVTCAAIASLIAGEGAGARYPCWAEHHRQQDGDEPALAAR